MEGESAGASGNGQFGGQLGTKLVEEPEIKGLKSSGVNENNRLQVEILGVRSRIRREGNEEMGVHCVKSEFFSFLVIFSLNLLLCLLFLFPIFCYSLIL